MSNIASVLKEEVSRISRKEIRRETSSLKKSSTTHRSEIAALKRRVKSSSASSPSRPGRGGVVPAAANEDSVSPGTRFSARSMASQRKRLGLSAAECGLLIGASAQSVYNWEEGKARPRAQHLPAIFALRNLGRRQANEILETAKPRRHRKRASPVAIWRAPSSGQRRLAQCRRSRISAFLEPALAQRLAHAVLATDSRTAAFCG